MLLHKRRQYEGVGRCEFIEKSSKREGWQVAGVGVGKRA